MAPRESARPSQRHRESGARKHKKRKSQSHHASRARPSASEEGTSARESQTLSMDALAQLNRQNQRNQRPRERSRVREYVDSPKRTRRDGPRTPDRVNVEKPRESKREPKRRKRREVSGAVVEEGRARSRGIRGGGASSYDSFEKEDPYQPPQRPKRKMKRFWIIGGVGVALLIIIIAVAVAVSKNKKANEEDSSDKKSNLDGVSPDSIPDGAPDWLNPFKWADTEDFNVTYTDDTVGDLPVMGLNTEWDDSKAANDQVPALDKAWGSYAKTPARGVNIGGWLSLEPFITPSLFNYDSGMGIIDEGSLCRQLGSSCAQTLEKHYSSFVTEQTFSDIAAAGLDHVRIPYSYWAVEIYDDDPYVFRTSWRYLLRGIEWARKHGLRVNLDLHALPGSQNGWNHSGRQGEIRWLNGTDGEKNRQRSLDVHDRLTKFFAQDRYKNIISHYGLANEPKMVSLSADDVVAWTVDAHDIVRKNGIKDAVVVFGDGFMGLNNWQGRLTGYENLALDVHQYVIFNTNQIVYTHQKKVEYACDGWTQQTEQSMDTSTGYGPTLFAEWSQADTDCARHLTNVGWGNRWEGTYETGNKSTDVLTPRCPTTDDRCSCSQANADPSSYSAEYKKFLKMFAEAQMHSFEKGWGWWYWTWKTESAPLWSYEAALKAGIMPAKAYDRDFACDSDVPDFGDLPEYF